MTYVPDILCIGSALWDTIGRTDRRMDIGHDVPGQITRTPGGVAMNIAMALAREGLRPALLTLLGTDEEGRALAAQAESLGLDTGFVTWSDSLPTDSYMAIEGAGGLVAAVADARSLEHAGAQILAPLADGRLGSDAAPFPGMIALDGNLTTALLTDIAGNPLFAQADLRIAPASPGKARRLLPLLPHPRATVYVNAIEAGLICGTTFASAEQAALALVAQGARRVIVTDGAAPLAHATPDGVLSATPPPVVVARVTGAGDTFMAAHIAAESRGLAGIFALEAALGITAAYVAAGSAAAALATGPIPKETAK
ncbi:PfkB family carbohydrate kinase [Tropicimonas sp. IMCC34043]|uniref:PfkB family carbohydrate kinase n=1 Tax=Tropicimonas sp. IMCC34043 TaxID=2248760 RepID=UPI000E2478B8|nr:PfkB family carbohydrate kinase [Tropicimonas sp. IMCC34043]